MVIGHLTGKDIRPYCHAEGRRVAELRSEGQIRGIVLKADRTGPILVLNEGYDMVDVTMRVEPIRHEWAEALAEGDAVFAERFGIQVEAGWSGFPEALPILLQAATSGVPGEWGPQLFFDDDGALVGNGGWKGPPEHGAAEVGYAVAPARQRRGIATAVVRELIERGRRAGLRVIVAHTLAEENASTKVLARCGFTRTAELDDPDEGRVWRWELRLRP